MRARNILPSAHIYEARRSALLPPHSLFLFPWWSSAAELVADNMAGNSQLNPFTERSDTHSHKREGSKASRSRTTFSSGGTQ